MSENYLYASILGSRMLIHSSHVSMPSQLASIA